MATIYNSHHTHTIVTRANSTAILEHNTPLPPVITATLFVKFSWIGIMIAYQLVYVPDVSTMYPVKVGPIIPAVFAKKCIKPPTDPTLSGSTTFNE